MAIDFIKIDSSQPNTVTGAAPLKQYVRQLRDAYNSGKQILAIMTHNNNGTDFSPIESLFGLPAGKGQTVFNLVNGSVGAMEGTFQNNNSVTITEQVG